MPKVTISFDIDDITYQKFVDKVGTTNLALYFSNFVSEFANNDEICPPIYHRSGKVIYANNFDEFFGILNSDKSVSIDEMNNAIKMRGGQLNNF